MLIEPLQGSHRVKGKSQIGILCLALLLRVLLLGIKPPHFDEGINGWFVDQMVRNGFYHYDPTNYHGPLHFYLLFVVQTLFGRHIEALRMVTVFFGLACVYLTLKFDRFLGARTCFWAALAMAVSPAATFYARYAIHETELAFFLMLSIWGILGLWQFGQRMHLRALALGVTGMVLTKETYVLHMASLLLALPTLLLMERLSPSTPLPFARQKWSRGDLSLIIALCAALIFFFYSGGFLDVVSLKGLYQTYAAWFQTGTAGNGHEKPFLYWTRLLARYEWTALLGLAFAPYVLRPNTNRLLRYVAIYGFGAFIAYSLVPYKTPWCIISIIWPFWFLFGASTDRATCLGRFGALLLGLLLLGGTLFGAVRLNFFRHTDNCEPYVYVQTLEDIHKITGPLLKFAKADPAAYHLKGRFYMSSFYPLPWMLGDFTNIGYYALDNPPPTPADVDFLLIEEARVPEVEPQLRNAYFTDTITLRGSQEPAKLYFNAEKFEWLFPGRAPELPAKP